MTSCLASLYRHAVTRGIAVYACCFCLEFMAAGQTATPPFRWLRSLISVYLQHLDLRAGGQQERVSTPSLTRTPSMIILRCVARLSADAWHFSVDHLDPAVDELHHWSAEAASCTVSDA
eukprot:gb/GFBE01082504.1/.p1 GENE.gb/GFBE01082504.1/~~gb/GFBE01082504.1/.p1  ORF type:complete len:119 (+),score=4.72 gb/GFBE01082504.1/:1-357(+)